MGMAERRRKISTQTIKSWGVSYAQTQIWRALWPICGNSSQKMASRNAAWGAPSSTNFVTINAIRGNILDTMFYKAIKHVLAVGSKGSPPLQTKKPLDRIGLVEGR